MGFLIGFICGIVFSLMLFPILIKWYIAKKIVKLTQGVFE
jgi:hypothetical protein